METIFLRKHLVNFSILISNYDDWILKLLHLYLPVWRCYYVIIIVCNWSITIASRSNKPQFWKNKFSKILYLYVLPETLKNTFFQKQPSRGALKKRCSENMQQIYRRTPMPKCDFNKVALQLYWNHTLACSILLKLRFSMGVLL